MGSNFKHSEFITDFSNFKSLTALFLGSIEETIKDINAFKKSFGSVMGSNGYTSMCGE